MKTYHLHANTSAYLDSPQGLAYMARVNRQPAWKPRAAEVHREHVHPSRPVKIVKREKSQFFPSHSSAAKFLATDVSRIKRAIEMGQRVYGWSVIEVAT